MEVENAAVHVEDASRQACWGEVTQQGNDVVRQEVVELNRPPPDHQTSLLKPEMH